MNNLLTVPLTPQFFDCIILLSRHFRGDYDKINAWLQTPNLNLDSKSPIELLLYNREKQLLRFIRDNMQGE